MSDYAYRCDKCPRTFKLEEFYDKHKKVHELKKQHKCEVCGFVYGAAKGLEGHMKTHTEAELAVAATAKTMAAVAATTTTAVANGGFNGFHQFQLSRQGVLAAAKVEPAEEEEKPQPVVTQSPPATLPLPPVNNVGGSGDYKVYDSLPEVTEANCTSSGHYSCAVCKRDFSGINSLRKHMPLHARKVQHSCVSCGHVFGKRDYLLDHIRSKHNSSNVEVVNKKKAGEVFSQVCDVCSLGFHSVDKLKEHQRLHINWASNGAAHPVMPFRCHICKEIFQLSAVLTAHIRTTHPGAFNNDVAASSPAVTPTPSPATNASVGKKTVFCPACNQGFTRHYNLKTHLQKMHPGFVHNNMSAEEFAAMTSSKATPSPPPVLINGVMPSALPTEPAALPPSFGHYFDVAKGTQMLACPSAPHCDQRFLRKTDLLIHLENEHGRKAVACTLCGEKFLQLSELREHITDAHANDGQEPPAVTIRPLSKPGPASAKRAKAAAAKKRKPGPASKTNAPAENRVSGPPSPNSFFANLPEHLEQALFDPNTKGFTCPDCGKTLQHKQSLVTHMRLLHSNYYGGNKWKGSQVVDLIMEESSKLSPKKGKSGPEANAQLCSVCEQVFPNPSSLRNHVVNVHIQGQNWTCDLCGKAFLSQANLDTHISAKHPNLNKRLQSLRNALGMNRPTIDGDQQPDAKRARVDLLASFSAADAHKMETDEYVRVNDIQPPPEEPETPLPMPMEIPDDHPAAATISTKTMIALPQHPEPQANLIPLKEEAQEEAPVASPSSEDEDVRYEAITEAFLFENQIIYPCYVILPFVNDQDIEQMTSRTAKEYYNFGEENMADNGNSNSATSENASEEDEDEGGQLTIDESQEEQAGSPEGSEEANGDHNLGSLLHKPIDPEILSLSLNSEGEAGDGRSTPKENNGAYNADDIKIDGGEGGAAAGFYPNLGDYSLPFSLSSLWKKKADVLPPETLHQLEMIQKMNEIKELNAPVSEKVKATPKPKAAKSSSSSSNGSTPKGINYPTNSGNRKQVENASPGQSTIVTEYENQVNSNQWPVDCIKCKAPQSNLENFNIHMNEHWSDDKCCPVCGLLINSKRFNFKQHLKIHTGEKPFVCKICSRSFRQKAHMVKHITTHREGGGSGQVAMSV